MRLLYLVSGLLLVGIGGIGILVPGLPTTVFFIMAAWCFSRSSQRLERWVLNLPGIGPMVSDFRSGLGMPRKAKIAAVSCIVIAVGISAGLLIDKLAVRLIVVAVGLIGVWYVGLHVPTRERLLEAKRIGDRSTGDGPSGAMETPPGTADAPPSTGEAPRTAGGTA